MQRSSEWGNFFSADLSPFCYNETVAQDYLPLTREQALLLGYRWKDMPTPVTGQSSDDSVRMSTISGRAFRLTKQELAYYSRQGLPLPERHSDERQAARMARCRPFGEGW